MGRGKGRPVWLGEDNRTWDHVRIHNQVFEDPRLGAYEQSIYAGIAIGCQNIETGEVQASTTDLAAYANCDERTVRRVVEKLEKWRYIQVIRRVGCPSIYRLLPPPLLSADSESDLTYRDAGQKGQENGTPDSQSDVVEIATPDSGSADPGLTVRRPRTHSPRNKEEEKEREVPPVVPLGGGPNDQTSNDQPPPLDERGRCTRCHQVTTVRGNCPCTPRGTRAEQRQRDEEQQRLAASEARFVRCRCGQTWHPNVDVCPTCDAEIPEAERERAWAAREMGAAS